MTVGGINMKPQTFNEIAETVGECVSKKYVDENTISEPKYRIEFAECPFTGTLEEMKVYEE